MRRCPYLVVLFDADEFLFLAEKERYVSLLDWCDRPRAGEPTFPVEPAPGDPWYKTLEEALVSTVARQVHAEYVRHRKRLGESMKVPEAFDELPEHLKQSNRDAAADIPRR